MAHKIPKSAIRRLIRALEHAPNKGKVMRDATARYGCSKSTLYKRMREVRGKTKEAPGRPREIDRDLVRAVIRLKERGKAMGPADAERELSTRDALKLLERTGWPGATDHSPSRINAIARKELGYRDQRRTRRFEADYAGQLYQMDFPRLEYFQLFDYDDEQDDYLLKVTSRSTAYKDPSGAFRAWVIGLIDDKSRVALGKIFAATGESPELGLEFLRWAFSREPDEHPLRYAPDALQCDAGAFDAAATERALDAAHINFNSGKGKGSQGKVERNFRTMWQRWELPLALECGQGHVMTLRELNARLHEYCVRMAREAHPRYRRHTREEVYATTLPGHARTLDADLVSLGFNVETRTVQRDGVVPMNNVDYMTPATTSDGVRIEPGDKVRVMESLDGQYRARLVAKAHSDAFVLERATPNRLNDYSGHEGPTMQERLRAQVDLRQPIGHILHENLDRQDLLDAASNGRVQMPDVLPRPHRIEPDSPFADRPNGHAQNGQRAAAHDAPNEVADNLSAHEARRYIGRRLRPTGHTYADVANVFDDILGQATRPELDEVLTLLLNENGTAPEHADAPTESLSSTPNS